jgi:cytochrome c5
MATLLQHSINGFNAMPPKGTCFTCSDADLQAAVEYMVGESK